MKLIVLPYVQLPHNYGHVYVLLSGPYGNRIMIVVVMCALSIWYDHTHTLAESCQYLCMYDHKSSKFSILYMYKL